MNYTIDDYEIEIRYNPNDIIFQVNKNEKLYQDVFVLPDIKKQNGFFDSIEKVKNFIENCFVNETEYYNEIIEKKTLILKLKYDNEMGISLNLDFELLPIRKDISNNQEIIDLKRTVKHLLNKVKNLSFLEKFYNHENLCDLIPYEGYENMMFSPSDERTIYSLVSIHNYFDGHNRGVNGILNFIDNHMERLNGNFFTEMRKTSFEDIMRLLRCSSTSTNFLNKNLFINNFRVIKKSELFTNENFRNIKCKILVFNELNNLVFWFLPSCLEKIVLINCNFDNFKSMRIDSSNYGDDSTTYLKNLSHVVLCNCTFKDLDSFKNCKNKIKIDIYGNKPIINKSLFGSNITINEMV
jgi:hypothetical protein